ncbi:hypothetical protein, partial [Acinetobacter baumannii]|uniref:hypothetical protein n=1 Tax=Acinetobacter baumannii TaxID=470 RepID=UPI001BC87A5A
VGFASVVFFVRAAGQATLGGPSQRRLPRSTDEKNNTGKSHQLLVFGFGSESEDGTDIYVFYIYSF